MINYDLYNSLLELEQNSTPVIIGVAGAGQMGTDLMVQLSLMPGVRLGAIGEISNKKALNAIEIAGIDKEQVQLVNTPLAIDDSIKNGKIAVTENLEALATSDLIQIVIDATGNPETGCKLAISVMNASKPIVMLNVEADITVGRYLKQIARKNKVVYTGAAGDEPACTIDLINFSKSIGLDVIAAGKGKNNSLNFNAVQEDYIEEAERRNMNVRVLVEFVDGTKTAVEMVAIANATNLVPDIPGMHGPSASIDKLSSVFCPKEEGGILNKIGVVDYSIGKGVSPGVFCIVKARHPRILERIKDLKVGSGPYFTLHRPFHLTSLEVPLSAVKAVLYKTSDIIPLDNPVAEVVAVTKKDLKKGEVCGRIGQEFYRGFAVTWSYAKNKGLLPIGLADGAKVIADIKSGEFLTSKNCLANQDLLITKIRNIMDSEDEKLLIK